MTTNPTEVSNDIPQNNMCRQVANIRHTLVGNYIFDHSDVVVAAPTTSSFST